MYVPSGTLTAGVVGASPSIQSTVAVNVSVFPASSVTSNPNVPFALNSYDALPPLFVTVNSPSPSKADIVAVTG